MNIPELRKKLNKFRTLEAKCKEELKKAEDTVETLRTKKSNFEKGREIIQEVARQTQQNLQFHISAIVSNAIKSVDPDWPDYEIEFVTRRNRTECDIFFVEGEAKQHPLDSSGGGAKDIASFAQRVAYWTLNKNRPTLILDEPFRNVSPDRQDRVSEMVKDVCNRLGIQIIMVSHADDINISADKTFLVKKTNNSSDVAVVSTKKRLPRNF